MNSDERTEFLQRRLALLEEERDSALEALELAGELDAFALDANGGDPRAGLLREVGDRAARLLPLEAAVLYLPDPVTAEFLPAHADPPGAATALAAELEGLILDQSFAHALLAEGPVFFLSGDGARHTLLHALKTHSRIMGMFAARLHGRKEDMPDLQLRLFPVLMLSAAHALEALELLERQHPAGTAPAPGQPADGLRAAYDRLRSTVDGMRAGVLLVDPETRTIVDANAEALRLVGLPRERVVGRPCTDHFCPGREDCCPVLDQPPDRADAERTIVNAAGETISVLKSVSRVVIDGRTHLVGSFIDITQRKRLETVREDVNRIMRHDLKAPLNGIIGLPAMLLDSGENLNPEQREGLRFIKSAGYKLLRMINMSLDLYKMETGTYAYAPEPHDVTAVIRTVLADLGDAMAAGGVLAAVTLDGAVAEKDAALPFDCEDFLLYSLLSNLLKNAIEGSDFGGIVTLDIRREPGRLVLAVHNDRPVPEAIRDVIFEKYVTANKRGGTGLGTYSARLIAETMGGTIVCDSSAERGTTMTVTLPVPERRSGHEETAAQAGNPARSTMRRDVSGRR